MNVHVFTILHVIFYIYVIYVKKVHKNPDIHATNQNLETRIDLSAAIHDIHTEGGTNCHTSTNMIRDERTAATGGRTINPFWVTGSTVKPEICIPFPIFFFLLSLPSFFLLFFSLYFSVATVQSIFEGKITAGKRRGRHTRAPVCVVFAKSSGTRSSTFQSLRIVTEREGLVTSRHGIGRWNASGDGTEFRSASVNDLFLPNLQSRLHFSRIY